MKALKTYTKSLKNESAERAKELAWSIALKRDNDQILTEHTILAREIRHLFTFPPTAQASSSSPSSTSSSSATLTPHLQLAFAQASSSSSSSPYRQSTLTPVLERKRTKNHPPLISVPEDMEQALQGDNFCQYSKIIEN